MNRLQGIGFTCRDRLAQKSRASLKGLLRTRSHRLIMKHYPLLLYDIIRENNIFCPSWQMNTDHADGSDCVETITPDFCLFWKRNVMVIMHGRGMSSIMT